MVAQLLATLPPRERLVIELRFGLTGDDPYTLEEIGKVFDTTRECARQILVKALKKLRVPHRSRKLEGFLDRR